MLPPLALNASTVDHFRKNIYRPRLCLLLLLILLSPYNTSSLGSVTYNEVSVSQKASQGWSISIIDGLVIAAPHSIANVPSPPSTPPKSVSKIEADNVVTLANKKRESKAFPSPAPVPSSSASNQQSQPPPGSVFRLPKLSCGLLIDTYVLPAILPLHVLWAIRFMGMAIEDGVIKISLMGSKSHFRSITLPALHLAFLACLTVVIGHPSMVDLLKSYCEVWRSRFGYEVTLGEKQRENEGRSEALLPLKLIVMLEAGACLVSLLNVSFKVQGTPLARILPTQIKLPSPSHAPSLIELLPLPATIKSGLLEAALAPSVAYNHRRRPMMPSLVPRTDAAFVRAQTNTHTAANLSSVASPHAPLQMPEESSSETPAVTLPSSSPQASTDNTYYTSSPSYRRRRAPRMQNQSVIVSTRWLLETVLSLYDKVTGAALYAIVTLRLPTLSPTSLPPVLSLLSLRSELAALTNIWTKARNSIECLEFVRRRWGVRIEQGQDPYTSVHKPKAVAAAASGDYQWKSYEDVYCAICFEQTRPAVPASHGSEKHTGASADSDDPTSCDPHSPDQHEFCRLDCGHELHDVCLVSWLTAQAFCPTCHVVLSFSPRPPSPTQQQQQQQQQQQHSS